METPTMAMVRESGDLVRLATRKMARDISIARRRYDWPSGKSSAAARLRLWP